MCQKRKMKRIINEKINRFEDVAIASNGISKFVIRGNTLVINYVDETDNGRYSCQVFNDYDRRGQRAEYLLNVIGLIERLRIENENFFSI